MIKRKKRPINFSDSPFYLQGQPGPHGSETKCNYIAGNPDGGEVYNCKGVKGTLEAVLIQTFHNEQFRVMVRTGERWLSVGIVQPSDDFVQSLEGEGKLTVVGKSPLQIEQEKKAAQQEQERIEADKRYKAERAQAIRERKAKEEAKNNAKRGEVYA